MTKHLRIAVLALASLLMGPSAHAQELPKNLPTKEQLATDNALFIELGEQAPEVG